MLTDVFVKSTDTHQYLHAMSYHVCYLKESIFYCLRFNRICSKNQSLDKRSDDLEVRLKSRGYNEKLVRQQILTVRKYRRTDFLHSHREEAHKNKLVFNITYYPNFLKLLPKIHLLLPPDREHSKVTWNRNPLETLKWKSFEHWILWSSHFLYVIIYIYIIYNIYIYNIYIYIHIYIYI